MTPEVLRTMAGMLLDPEYCRFPEGIGRWDRFWELVDPPAERILALCRDTKRGDELGIGRIKKAVKELETARNRAISEYLDAKGSHERI